MNNMTTGSCWKHILIFSLPIMLGNFLQQLYNTVDGIVVGRYAGEAAFSAVGLNFSLAMLFIAFASGISVGVGVVISQYFGAGHDKDLATAIDTSLIVSAAFGAGLMVIGLLLAQWLLKTVLQVSDNLYDMALLYFRIFCIGIIPNFIYNCIAAILRGVGDSKSTMYFLIVATVINVVLDILFVAVFNWGVGGVAAATVIAQYFCLAASYIYLRRRFKPALKAQHFDKKICTLVLKLGLPGCLQMGIVAIGSIALQRLVNGFGDYSIAGYSAANRIDGFMFIPISSFQTALANFTGQNIGAGKADRIRKGLISTFAMCLSVVIVIATCLYVFTTPIVSLFGISGESLSRGVEQVRYLAPGYLCFSCYLVLGGILQGSGDTLVFSSASLASLATRVLGSYISVSSGLLGYSAAWVITPYSWILALVITLIRYLTGGWKRKAVAGVYAEKEEKP